MEQDDLLVFAEEDGAKPNTEEVDTIDVWKILIVDDEPHVHQVTELVLRDFVFENKKIKFFNAYSAAEAKRVLEEINDISLAIVDVVMEEDDAGLSLVKYVRESIKDKKLRIILRTGQPGVAPEKEVIIKYDINDYKEKVELSAQKLITSVIVALRNYEYIAEISALNANLEQRVADRVDDLKKANIKLQETLEEIQDDQEAARIMQDKLFPKEKTEILGYKFSSKFYSSMTLSGDFLDYFEINERYVGFYIADVSGHGVSSAIVTVLLKNFIDNAIEKFHNENDFLILTPPLVCKRLNNELLREKLGKYLTIFFGIIDTVENKMHYINCGQFPYPFIADICGDKENSKVKISVLEGKGTPVGLFKTPLFSAREIMLPKCFKMVMFSDGIIEVLSAGDIKNSDEYLHELFSNKNIDIDKISSQLGLENRSFFPDDLTFLMIEKDNSSGDNNG
ncbi:MAG: SpoIIE family protein phosphatase [Spirochaetaceae bacterium]|nr:SpoIIE family protein phosphatase [Spirochaetaceae bacterium]